MKSYEMEYETTPITLKQVREKYNLKPKDTKGWKKKKTIPTPPKDSRDIPTVLQTPPKESKDMPTVLQDIPPAEPTNQDDLIDDIIKAKRTALREVNRYFDNIDPNNDIEVKEFKDMVSVLTNIDSSIPKATDNQGPTVNVMIQNLMGKFKDDC